MAFEKIKPAESPIRKLGVLSDTHGHVQYTRAAIRMLEALEVDAVLHCGDIGSTSIVELFAARRTHFVFGNVDGDRPSLAEAIHQAGQTCHGVFGSVSLGGWEIAFLHGDDAALLRQTIVGGRFDLVCYGHTHVAEQHREGTTRVLNPGALYRAQPHSLAVVDLASLEATIVAL